MLLSLRGGGGGGVERSGEGVAEVVDVRPSLE
jgi:hypothetical protein